jgi:hypothetical protein
MAAISKTHPKLARNISAKIVREVFHYSPRTGILTWRFRKNIPNFSNARFAGKPAGCTNKMGYMYTCINYEQYLLHRIIWLYMTGKFPAKEIDHINGVKNDNRWKNLRIATHKQNATNRGPQANNKIGIKWVRKRGNRWHARCGHTYLGIFTSAKKAHKVARKFAAKHHGEFFRAK